VQSLTREARQVWIGNFRAEIERMQAALEAISSGATVAFAVSLPGDLSGSVASQGRLARHEALLESTELLRPLQLALALASEDGAIHGCWSFNLRFDAAADLHTEAGLAALRADGVDLPRHATDGIEASLLQVELCLLPLLSDTLTAPQWVTFSGTKGFGHLMKLVTGRPLPADLDDYNGALARHCPFRHELEPRQPEHTGDAHAAGGRALAALTLYTQRRQQAGAWLGDTASRASVSPSGDDRPVDAISSIGAEPAAAAASLWAAAARLAMSAGTGRQRQPLAPAGSAAA